MAEHNAARLLRNEGVVLLDDLVETYRGAAKEAGPSAALAGLVDALVNDVDPRVCVAMLAEAVPRLANAEPAGEVFHG